MLQHNTNKVHQLTFPFSNTFGLFFLKTDMIFQSVMFTANYHKKGSEDLYIT